MEEEYQIVYDEKPGDAAWGIIGRGLGKYNNEQVGDDKYELLCFALHAPDQTIVGGIIASTDYDWLYVDLLWIPEELRGKGYGHRLLTLAEDKARERGAKNAYLDTFSFQVPDFYKQHGYEVFGELSNFPPGHQRYFLKKEL